MRAASFPPFVLVLAIAGCTAARPTLAPDPVPSAVTGAPLALDAPAPAATGPDSLPFRSLLVDEGPGRWLAAGPDEKVVLRSAADLDALLARHTRHRPNAQPFVPSRPVPGASFGPPMMEPPPGQPTPDPNPEPLPENLTKLDWGAWQVIAFVDGAVEKSASSRIAGVFDLGDKLEVRTTRWVAPPYPGNGPSPSSRVHFIAIARTEKPIAFAATAEVDGTLQGNGGSYSIGGGPAMSPVWKAVQNPLWPKEKIEPLFKSTLGDAVPTSYSFEKRTIAWIQANVPGIVSRTRFTPDSEVWVGIAEGDLPASMGSWSERFTRVVALYSIEDEFPRPFAFTGKGSGVPTGPASPHIQVMIGILPESNTVAIGETVRFSAGGPLPDTTGKLVVTAGAAAPVVREFAMRDLANLTLTIDKATLPGLRDVSAQAVSIRLEWSNGQGTASTGRDLIVLKERGVLTGLNPPVQGPGTAAEYAPQAGETAWDAFVRRIATEDFKGQDVKWTTSDTTFGPFKAATGSRFIIAADTPVKTYEVRGTFPKAYVPQWLSGKDADEVIVPKRLKIVTTAEVPVVVLSVDAYAD